MNVTDNWADKEIETIAFSRDPELPGNHVNLTGTLQCHPKIGSKQGSHRVGSHKREGTHDGYLNGGRRPYNPAR